MSRSEETQMTQAQRIVEAIRSKPLTYGELEALKVSTCPWRRLTESGYKHLKQGERIERKVGEDGLVRIGVVR